jgi:hypothetical protein
MELITRVVTLLLKQVRLYIDKAKIESASAGQREPFKAPLALQWELSGVPPLEPKPLLSLGAPTVGEGFIALSSYYCTRTIPSPTQRFWSARSISQMPNSSAQR